MRLIDAATTARFLSFDRLVPALQAAFRSDITVPPRHVHEIAVPGAQGKSLIMPAWNAEGYYGVKIVNIYPGNGAQGLPGLHASYLLHDARTGQPVALIDGDEITARRTAAAAALGAQFLAREDAATLLVAGTGRVGKLVPAAMRAVRPIRQVLVWNRTRKASEDCVAALRQDGFAAEVADDLSLAAGQADIVSCATLATAPIVRGEWLKPGSHLDLIGSFAPDMQEADPACFARARTYVDTSEAPTKAGDLLLAFAAGTLARDAIAGDLFGLCAGTAQGRASAQERTVFKAVGNALEDLAAAILVFEGVRGLD